MTETTATTIPTAAYVHVPFCAHRCGYCDFTLVAGRDDLVADYLKALEIELNALERPRRISTLFLGGGTPTHLSVSDLERLLDLVCRWFEVAPGYEFSVEANPAGLGREKIRLLAERGVNRVSLGVQSFDVNVLRTLERDHDVATIEIAVHALRECFDNISLDLIFGVPGQSLELWRETLARAIALRLQHISTYGLTVEKGTAFWSRRAKGNLPRADEELERAMYALAMDELPAAGFEQYELSNFAKPGFHCQHNETYWAGRAYYGFGPGAARYLGGRRTTNHRSVTTWINRVLSGKLPVGDVDELSPAERAREALVVGLRRARGVNRREFRDLTGFDLDELAGRAIRKHVAAGLLESAANDIRLTREGRFLADSVVVDLV